MRTRRNVGPGVGDRACILVVEMPWCSRCGCHDCLVV